MTRHPSRLLPVALAAILVLGACGSDDDGNADDVPPTADESSSDDGLMAPRPIELSGSGAGFSPGAATASLDAESAPGADRSISSDMIAPYRIATFVAGEGLPELPTNDVGYAFEAGRSVTPEQVAELAGALGVSGEPVRIDEGFGVSWRVGPEDGSAPSLWVYEDAQLSWSYNAAWATQGSSAGCGVAGSAGAAEVDVVEPEPGSVGADVDAVATEPAAVPDDTVLIDPICETPAPPEGVPSADEAVARTRELMSALGLDPDQFAIEPYADEWYASVSASEQLDGAFAGRRVDTGFGAAGVLQYAGGQLAEPVRVGPYPLVDLDAALARLNDPSGFYAGGGMVALDAAVARQSADSPVAVDVVDVPPATAVAPVEPTTSEAAPLEPELVTVTLVDVQADVWWAWDVDGSVWLLPAYRFIGDDGGWYTVPAVTDEFLVQVPVDSVPVTEPAPMPVEPAPPETVPVESVPVESVPVDTVVDVEPLQGSVGKTLADFTADAEALGLSVRVVEQDGVALAVTMDFSPTRVNVAVTGEGDSGLVTAIVDTG